MEVTNLIIEGRGSQNLSPVSGTDLVPLGYLQTQLSGYAPFVHTHVATSVTDFIPAVLAVLTANGVPLSGTGGGQPLPGGGLKSVGVYLAVDSGVVSLIGHTHRSVDIVDLASGVAAVLVANLNSSATVLISGTGPFSFNVNATPAGGLLVSGTGLQVDFGAGHSQVARGDHTHTLLHNPVTLGTMSSLSGTLSGQQISFELVTVAGGGLVITPSGVQVDWAVVQRAGSYSSGTGLSVVNTTSLKLSLAGNVLSGTVALDASPPGGTGGLIVAGANGLRVMLGTTSTTAAAGNHVHSVVTSGTDGFMAANDKVRLDALWAGGGTGGGIYPVNSNTLALSLDGSGNLSGTVTFNAAPVPGHGMLGADGNGLYVVLGTASNQAAAGNHLHDTRYPVITSGTLTFNPGIATPPANASGVAAWFQVTVNSTNYKLPLYL